MNPQVSRFLFVLLVDRYYLLYTVCACVRFSNIMESDLLTFNRSVNLHGKLLIKLQQAYQKSQIRDVWAIVTGVGVGYGNKQIFICLYVMCGNIGTV